MPGGVKIEWNGQLNADSVHQNPPFVTRDYPVLVLGQLRHLKQIDYATIGRKLNPDITEEVFDKNCVR